MPKKAKSTGLVITLTIAGALFGWLISPMTDLGNVIGIILFTPPTWAIAGFSLALLIEWHKRKKQGVNPPAQTPDGRPEAH
jgi:hypothetical protein